MLTLKEKMDRVIGNGLETHYIFKEILRKETAILPDEEILDFVFIEREYIGEKKSSNYVPAKLIAITTHGLTIAEEGIIKVFDNKMGYRLNHIQFKKITNIELDICLLVGVLRVSTNSRSQEEATVEFNTAKYYKQFEEFIKLLRQKVIELE